MKRPLLLRALCHACLSLSMLIGGSAVALAQGAPAPSKEVEALKKDVGTWVAKMTMWMPDAPEPVKAEGIETNRMMGAWLVSDFKGNIFGQQFEGRGQFGYDAKKKKYVGTWIDNMEPFMSTMEGSWDEGSQTMTYMSQGTNSQTGEPTKGKTVVVYKKDGSHVMTMYMESEPGKFTKSMEIVYTRKD